MQVVLTGIGGPLVSAAQHFSGADTIFATLLLARQIATCGSYSRRMLARPARILDDHAIAESRQRG